MTIDTTITGDTILLFGACLLFFADWYLDSRIRNATGRLRKEHQKEINRLAKENRELRSEVTMLSSEVKGVDLGVKP